MALGTLVTRLSADTAPLAKGLSQGKSLISGFASGISSMLGPAVAAFGAAFGAVQSVGASKTQLNAEQKLAASLEATGNAAGFSGKEIAAYASELQGLTNFGDEVTLEAAAIADGFGNISGDNFKRTLALSQDMAAKFGQQLPEAAKKLSAALADPIAGMGSLKEAGVVFTDQQKEQIKTMMEAGDVAGAQAILLDGAAASFGGTAQKMADPWTQFTNTLGDFAENIGFAVLPQINVLLGGLNSLAGGVVSGTTSFREFGIEMATILTHMGDLFDLGLLQAELFFGSLPDVAGHFFTVAMPEYLNWFGKEWGNIFFTAGDYALTVFKNLGENIKMAWQQVLNFFQRKPVEFKWTDLREGAVNAIGSLPDIPERVASEWEKNLRANIDAMSAGIQQSMDETRANLTEKYNPLKNEFAGQDGTTTTTTTTKKKMAQSTSGPSLALQGSSDAIASIFANMRRASGGKGPEDETAENTSKLVNTNEQMLKEMRNGRCCVKGVG